MTVITRFGEYSDSFAKYLRPTNILDFDIGSVRKIANIVVKDSKTDYQAIRACWEFIAAFPIGFDREDMPVSALLPLRRGQCNTKTTMFAAILRCAGVPCRVHAWSVHKLVHKKHMPALVYAFTPSTTLFLYPEVFYKGSWMLLSDALSSRKQPDWDVCPFDNASARKHPLREEWISSDLGSFWHPDIVFQRYGTNASGWRYFAFPLAQLLLNK